MSERIPQNPPATCYKLQTNDQDLLAIPKDDLVRMLALLYLIREFELIVLDFKDADLVHGPAHTSVGQEAVAAAVAVALRKTDMIASTHRAHGHFVSKALMYYAPDDYQPLRDPVTPKMQEAVNKTLAEIMGLKDGWCGGRGGSMHLYDGESGNLGSNAIVGGGIPLATGAAWAQKLQKKDRVVVSFFGDGAINQGCFHEVANMAALWGVPILYLVENNLYAVGTRANEASYVQDLALRTLGYGFDSMIVDGMDPVSMYIAVHDVVEKMRREPFPFLIEAKTYRFFHHAGRIAGSAYGYRTKEEEEEWKKRDPYQVFPEKLIRYGIITQEDDEQLQNLAKEMVAKAADFCTEEKDGKRYIPASKWPDPESAVRNLRSEKDVFQGIRFKEREDFTTFKPMTYVEAIAKVTLRNMERDERVIVLGEEVANLRGGAYGATRGIKEVFPERLINTPISETGFVGMAGGAASVGLRPVVEIMFPDFALMASDQLFNQIGKLRHMYGGNVSFPLVVRTRVAIGFGYGGQHSMNPSAFFSLFSGWRVVAPATAFDYIGLFNTAMRFEDPVLIIEHGMLYQDEDQVPADDLDYFIEYGKARIVREGSDLTVVTYSKCVKDCLQAAEELGQEGISVEVIDLRTVDYVGMDYATIGESVKKTGSVLIVEQNPRSMSLSGRIADEIQERFFDYLDCPVGKLTGVDVPPPVSRKLEEAVLPSLEQIKAKMRQGAKHFL
ncbi:MAG: dehydrogenase E1 component subunit alpha/beta [Anaerolineae bacterium]|nr:dehydrogenase E1 component subunit alpha/beta [Anaerolineae bacterium]